MRSLAALAVLVLLSIALYVSSFDSFQLGTYVDDAHYVVLAQSIAEGDRGYGLVNEPEQTLPTRYPFGWPLLLAPIYALAGGAFSALKLVSTGFTVANILILALCWRQLGFSSRLFALIVAGLYALSPMVVGHARMVMSEPAFLFFVLVTLALTTQQAKTRRSRLLIAACLGVSWGLVVYVRTIGVTALAASAIWLAIKRDVSKLLLGLLSMAACLILVVSGTALKASDLVNIAEYKEQFSEPAEWGQGEVADGLVERSAQGTLAYVDGFVRDSVLPYAGAPTARGIFQQAGVSFAPSMISLVVVGLMLIGYVVWARRSLHPSMFFVPLFMAVTVVWPWRGDRFLYGILPFLYAYLLIGANEVVAAPGRRWPAKMAPWSRAVAGAGLLGFLLLQLVASIRIDDALNHVVNFQVGTTWLRENAPASAVIAAEQPQIAYLYSHRATVPLQETLAPKGARVEPTFVLVWPELRWSAAPRELRYSSATQGVLEQLRSGRIRAALVFEDKEEMVQVYRIEAE